jgi:hypothetical protein
MVHVERVRSGDRRRAVSDMALFFTEDGKCREFCSSCPFEKVVSLAPSMTVHVSRNGQEIGQYTQHDFNSLMQTGRLLPTDHFWVEGMDAWKSVSIAKSYFGQREKCRHCAGKMTEQKPVTSGPRMGQMKSICLKCGHTEYH